MPVGDGFGVAFRQDEYDQRLTAVCQGMADRGAEVLPLFAPTNIFYLEATIAAIRPGVRSQDVQAACQAVIDRRGYEPTFGNGWANSIGVGFAPGWGDGHIMDLKHHDGRELRPGWCSTACPRCGRAESTAWA
jgi:Xaa-Pro aminopeptidase